MSSLNSSSYVRNAQTGIINSYGPYKKDSTFNILVVSTSDYCKRFSEHLLKYITEKENVLNFKIIMCCEVRNLLQSSENARIDFIVFIMDTYQSTCTEDVERNLRFIDKSFFAGRICLVNGNEIPPAKMGIHVDELLAFVERLQCPFVAGDVIDDGKCRILAERVMILAKTVCGLKTGMPLPYYPEQYQ